MEGAIHLCVCPHHLDKTNTIETSARQTRSHSDIAMWPDQEWFPDLIKMSIDFPLDLARIQKLLKQSFSHTFYNIPERLKLHAWRLSADSMKIEAFHKMCPVGSTVQLKISGRCLENGV